MATRRNTGRGSPTIPEPRPLIETNASGAINILEGQYARIEKLDASDWAAVEDAQSYLLADVERVFGAGSAEWSQIFQNNIINTPRYLPLHDYDDFDEGSWQNADKVVKVKAGIDKMLPRIRRLIDRAKELAALHAPQGGNPMNPFNLLPHEDFLLLKPDGERRAGRGLWGTGYVTVFDAGFPVARGDTIERTLPNGIVERYEVLDLGFEKGMHTIPDAYNIKLRSASARPAARPAVAPQVVTHNTTYNIHGVAGAVGPGATATGNTLVGQATHWNGVDRDRLVADVAKLRAALATEASEDDDAAAELGPVGEASKALKAGDESGFKAALKRLGQKTLAVAGQLGLAYFDHYARQHLGLPPAGGT